MTDLAIWCRATELIRGHGEQALQHATGTSAASDAADALLRAVGQLLRAAIGCRRPALYMRFNWDDVTDEQLELEMFGHDGRTDFGFKSVDDLPHRGPLIALEASTADAARAEAERYWDDRASMGPADAAPADFSVFNEHGLSIASHQLDEFVDPASTRWPDEEACGLPCCKKADADMLGPDGGQVDQRP